MAQVETELALLKTLRGTFNASGIAEASAQVPANTRWKIRLFSTTTTSTRQTTCTIRRGSVDGPQLDFSVTGNGDTSSTDIDMGQNQTLYVRWTNGTTSANASLNVEGSEYIKGRRGY